MYHLHYLFLPNIMFTFPLYYLGTISSTIANIAEYSPPTLIPVKNLKNANYYLNISRCNLINLIEVTCKNNRYY